MTRPAQPPHGSALASLASGWVIDSLEAKREALRVLTFEFEAALDEAEQREARIARRRGSNGANPSPRQVGKGGPLNNPNNMQFVERKETGE